MKTNRRDFIKVAGVAGTGAIAGGITSSCAGTNSPDVPKIWEVTKNTDKQVFNMSGYAAPKLEVIRLGIIGIGGRGLAAVKRMSLLEGVEIKAVCDLLPDRVNAAQEWLKKMKQPPCKTYADGSQELWKEMCQKEDLDLVYVTTPRDLHPSMCVYAMETGAHTATEIPAARKIEECWQLVEASEKDEEALQYD